MHGSDSLIVMASNKEKNIYNYAFVVMAPIKEMDYVLVHDKIIMFNIGS